MQVMMKISSTDIFKTYMIITSVQESINDHISPYYEHQGVC